MGLPLPNKIKWLISGLDKGRAKLTQTEFGDNFISMIHDPEGALGWWSAPHNTAPWTTPILGRAMKYRFLLIDLEESDLYRKLILSILYIRREKQRLSVDRR